MDRLGEYQDGSRRHFLSDEQYRTNFEYVADRYVNVVGNVRRTGNLPGPGRGFFDDLFGVDSYRHRFNYDLRRELFDHLENKCEDFKGLLGVGDRIQGLYFDGYSYGLNELVSVSHSLYLQSRNMFDVFHQISVTFDFPRNIYGLDMEINKNVFADVNQELEKLRMVVHDFNDLNPGAGVSNFPFQVEGESFFYGDGTNVAMAADGLALEYDHYFEQFFGENRKSLARMGAVYVNYEDSLNKFIAEYRKVERLGVEVSIFDVIGPFSFLQVFLVLLKHAAELRENSFIGHKLIKNSRGLT